MTRFGVMKHLKLLEEAGLVVTRRRGREKLHFLNPVPIRLVHDRWVSKYAEPWAAGLSGLKHETGEHHGEGLRDLHPHHARAALGGDHRPRDPGQVQLRRRRRLGLDAGLRASRWAAPRRRRLLGEGEVLEVDPPRRLVHTMVALWGDDVKAEGAVAGHVGDRAGRRLVPPHRHPRPAARGRQRPALRRLADDPVGPQDLARDRGAAHDAGLASLRGRTVTPSQVATFRRRQVRVCGGPRPSWPAPGP